MQAIVRPATLTDQSAILEIINKAILHTTANYHYNPLSITEQEQWFEKKQEQDWPVLVAEVEGAILGFGTYGPFRTKIAYQYTVEHTIYVAEGAQGRGLGSLLLTQLIAIARTQGFHTMIGGVDGDNKGSLAFHKRHGFVEVARFREVGYKFDRWLDMVFLQLML